MIFMSGAHRRPGLSRGGTLRPMKLRTRLNLIVAGLTAMFVAVLIFAEIEDTRSSVNEEVEAANRVGSQLLGRLAAIYSREGDYGDRAAVPGPARARAGQRCRAALALGRVVVSLAGCDL